MPSEAQRVDIDHAKQGKRSRCDDKDDETASPVSKLRRVGSIVSEGEGKGTTEALGGKRFFFGTYMMCTQIEKLNLAFL